MLLTNVEKMIADYQQKMTDYDILIEKEFEEYDEFTNKVCCGEPDDEDKIYHNTNIRRLTDLKQICLQVTKDLEDLL